jgi:hypothetical protein
MAVNFGNVVTDPAQQKRIMGLAEGMVAGNEAGAGGAMGYMPGWSRDKALEQAAYSFFPGTGGGAQAAPAQGSVSGTPTPGFSLATPKPAAYGAFTAPDPATFAKDPSYQFTLSEEQRALEHSAAARGSYFTPNTMQGLTDHAAGRAGQEYGNAYDRALGAYTTNRDTQRGNFADEMTAFGGDLSAFGATTGAANADRNFSLASSGQAFDQKRLTDQSIYDRSRQTLADQQALDDRNFSLTQRNAALAQPAPMGSLLTASAPTLPTPDPRRRQLSPLKYS